MWREGADLTLTDNSGEALGRMCEELGRHGRAGQGVQAVAADLMDPEAPAEILAQARRLRPRLDALVNNAAVIGPIGALWDNDWERWTDTIRINLLAPVALCRLVVPWMREGGGGSIITLSGGGATGPRPRFSAYATAKAGLVRFSETLAQEAAAWGIRVNCMAPGALNTAMQQAVLQAGSERAGAREFTQAQQAGEAASPEQAAELCVFLASPASEGISGRLISAVWDPWPRLAEYGAELRDSDIYTLRRIVPADRGKDWK